MTAHPRGPRDPKKPTKSRHIVEKAKTVKQDARGSQEIMARDTMRALAWLNEAPLRTITSQGMRDWVAQQDPPWTRGYWVAIKAMVQTALADDVAATGAETRSRLLKLIDQLVPETRHLVLWKGGCKPTDPAVKDPRTPQFLTWRRLVAKREIWDEYLERKQVCILGGVKEPAPPFAEPWSEQDDINMAKADEACPLLTVIDHAAVQGYVKIYAQLSGLLTEKHQHLHLHTALSNGGDLSEVPEEELIEAERITNQGAST